MAIGVGVPLKVTISGRFLGQVYNNVQWYLTDGAAFLTADAVGVGEAYWNNIKARWRAAQQASGEGLVTNSILVSEPGDTGAFGEFAVPTGERSGTRTSGDGDFLPPFNAAGIRLTVATRTTRPGQKRIVGATEDDNAGGNWSAEYLALVNAVAPIFAEPMILGVPVATGVLIPIIVKSSTIESEDLTWQEVTGFVTNNYVTSQVSRKIGRGI